MKSIEHIRTFLDAFVTWASAHGDVQAIALVGSYARGEARDDSDIDLVLLTNEPQRYREDLKWIERFGTVKKHQTEDYGKLTSIRVWYQNGIEVEYGITVASSPILNSKTIQNRVTMVIFSVAISPVFNEREIGICYGGRCGHGVMIPSLSN